jgi:hypothetical protein
LSNLVVIIENVQKIPLTKARRLRAVFNAQIPGIGVMHECRLLVNGDRRTIAGPSINDAVRGWVKTVEFEEPFIQQLLRAYDEVASAEGD